MFKINKLLIILLVVVGWFGLVGFRVAWAEPQFGGDVSNVIRCTCGSNAGGVYFEVDDPHGDGEGGHGRYVAPPGVERDCAPINNGEEVLGMHNENDEECKQRIGYACITVARGKGVDIYGTSPNNCGSHKTIASSSVVDDIKRRRDNGEEVVGHGTTNSSQKTNKSSDVVDTIKQKRDNGEEVKSSDDINNPQATHNSEDVVRDIVQRRDNGEEVRGSESESILRNMGINVDSDGGLRVLGEEDKKKVKSNRVKKNEFLTDSRINRQVAPKQEKNNSWKFILAGASFATGGFFVWRAGMRLMKN